MKSVKTGGFFSKTGVFFETVDDFLNNRVLFQHIDGSAAIFRDFLRICSFFLKEVAWFRRDILRISVI